MKATNMTTEKSTPMRQQPFDAGQNYPTEMQPATPRPGRRPATAKPVDLAPIEVKTRKPENKMLAHLRLMSLRKQRDATRA